jgi:hypothetical protein
MSRYAVLNRFLIGELVEAALDQPTPTPRLRDAVNAVLKAQGHPDRDRSREQRAA